MQSVAALVVCVYMIVASAVSPSGLLFGGENVTITRRQDQLIIKCGSEYQEPSKSILNVKTVKIEMCPPPDKAYVDELKALNVNLSAMEELDLNEVRANTILEAKHFKGLNITKLHINNNYQDRILMLGKDAFEHLPNLSVLNLKKAQLRPLSNASKVQRIEVDSGSVYYNVLSGCKELRELNLSRIIHSTNRVLVPSHWLGHCTNLEILRVSLIEPSLSLGSLTNMLDGAKNLKELALTVCELNRLPWDLLSQAKHLSRLILNQNNLFGVVLRNFKINSLNYLDLSECHITVLKGLPVSHASQLEIDLRGNYLLDVQLQEEDYQMLRNNNMPWKYSRSSTWATSYTQEALEAAIQKIDDKELSYAAASRKYGIPTYKLSDRFLKKTGIVSKTLGRSTPIPIELEIKLANCLRMLEKWGWGLSREEGLDITVKFVRRNELDRPFKNGRPGPD